MNPEKISNLLSDVEISGTITFRGTLTFDGQLRNGNIVGEDLDVGPKAIVKGDIKANSLVLSGAVNGDVVVAGRCELKSTANLTGSLTSNRLAMQDGATLIGGITINRDPAKMKPGS